MTHTVSFARRVVTAGLLGAVAGFNLDLWANYGYQHISTIGPLFPLNGIASSILALACLATPRHLVAAATLGALILSVNVGQVGFTESTTAPLFSQAIAVEAAAIVAGALLAVTSRHQPTIQEVLP
jgi:hypothetical protein